MKKKYAVQIEFITDLTHVTSVIDSMKSGYITLSWVDGEDDSLHIVKEMEVEFVSHEEMDAYINALNGAVYRIYQVEEKTMLVYDREHDTRFTR